MKPHLPTIAFTLGLFNCADGPAYCVYTQAYCLEMTMDDEWPLNTIIMSPPHLVSAMTRWADVASMGAIPGASYTPGDGDYQQLSNNNGRWVLARPTDDMPRILAAKLGVLFLISSIDELGAVLGQDDLNASNLIVAFQSDSGADLETDGKTAAAVRASLRNTNAATAQILVSASFDHGDLLDRARLPEVAGLLLLDVQSPQVVELIGLLTE